MQNFLSKFNLNTYYDFLNSLTLLEESAFIHTMIFILLLITITDIVAILFANNLIKYLTLI